MKKQKMLFVGLLGLVALASCRPSSSDSTGSSGGSNGSDPSVSEPSVSVPTEAQAGGLDHLGDDLRAPFTPEDGVNYANGVKNFAISSGEDRSEILGLLEKFTIDSFLGGIPYRDNSGYVLYHNRLTIPADDYVVGYGFGVGEATINAPLTDPSIPTARRMYYHSWNSSEPGTINYLDSQDSVTADLHGMVSSAYWGTRFNADKTGYEWYPLLANGVDRPVPLNLDPGTQMATKWRVPVKVGGDLKYNSLAPTNSAFAGRAVALEDYLTPFKLMIEKGWFRATDLASRTSGFVGVADQIAKDLSQRDINQVQGIQLNAATNSIDFEFNTPKTAFYAMYNLSSSLFTPIPMDFIDHIGGPTEYGKPNPASILSLGVYMLELWETDKETVFKKNPLWIESARYSHAGYVFTVLKDNIAAFQEFLLGKLDSAGVPPARLAEYKSDPRARQTKGDTVWKLQTNAADQELWDSLFGPEGTVSPGSEWDLKPVMSNHNFLNGVYYSINRQKIATDTGSRPATGFLSEAYMVDPESGISWRESAEGKKVLEDRLPDTHGYSFELAATFFNEAIDELVEAGAYKRGTINNPTKITLQAIYQSATQATNEGGLLEVDIEKAFNDSVEGFTLDIESYATENWKDAYDAAMYGEFDFAFGSISGNTLDPISFMDTVSSDNRSGFTLSWGTDTSIPTEKLTFKDEVYAFDTLVEAASGQIVVKNGRTVLTKTNSSIELTVNVGDPMLHDVIVTGTYYIDPSGKYTVEPDEEGISYDTGAFVSLIFYDEEGAFITLVDLAVETFEEGQWTAKVVGAALPRNAYYLDIASSFIETYEGTENYTHKLTELLWSWLF